VSSKLFEPFALRSVQFRNRIMMSPMCQYCADPDGRANDWHLVHYPTRAIGGVGLVMLEATAVESRGRISGGDLGLWDDAQIEPLAQIVRLCHQHGAKVGVQLAHAGRKAWTDSQGFGLEVPVAPSAVPFDDGWAVPHALRPAEMAEIVRAFAHAAERAEAAGFDVVEIHGAHGYLISEFLSPLANHRTDEYGGSLENRLRFPMQVTEAVRESWPGDRPLFFRLSATDWAEGGNDVGTMVEVAKALKVGGVDLVDVSSGGVTPAVPRAGLGYQVPFAERIRREAQVPTAAVGLITAPELAEEIVRNERADLVALGRELLRSPYWPLEAARRLRTDVPWPKQYQRAKL